jgi:hypothetical protein
MEPLAPVETINNDDNHYSVGGWLTIFLFFLFIAAIITLIALNHNNAIDVKNSIPSYNIFYPAGNTYVTTINMAPLQAHQNITFPIHLPDNTPNPFWMPYVNLSDNTHNGVGLWSVITVAPTSFMATLMPNQSYVKLYNTVYGTQTLGGQTTPPSNLGYVTRSFVMGVPGEMLVPTGSSAGTSTSPAALIFIYTDLGNNEFTLQLPPNNANVTLFVTAVAMPGYLTLTSNTTTTALLKLVPVM